jgi:hypothetical protein
MNWTHDAFPVVINWLADAATNVSQPRESYELPMYAIINFNFIDPMNSQGASARRPRRLRLHLPRPANPSAAPLHFTSRLFPPPHHPRIRSQRRRRRSVEQYFI